MNMHGKFALAEEMTSTATASVWSFRLGLAVRLAVWVKNCADNYAAAAAYEDLSRLTDVELKHRGLSRDTLLRDLTEDLGGPCRSP